MKTDDVLLDMSITDKISRKVFLAVYDSYAPNEWTKFAFRYFSKDTLPKDKYIKNIFIGIELALFFGGYIGTILELKHNIIGFMIYPFIGLLCSISILIFGAFIMNNRRIKKQMKLLKVNAAEYETLKRVYL